MENTKKLPLLCTRGAFVFPLQTMAVEVGRPLSVGSVNFAADNNVNIVISSQMDLTKDNPPYDEIYKYGVICRIKSSSFKTDHLRVTFSGLMRCEIHNIQEENGALFCDCTALSDVVDDYLEIEVLTKKAISEFNIMAQKMRRPVFNLPSDNIDLTVASSLADSYAQVFVQGVAEKQKYVEEINLKNRLMMVIQSVYRERQFETVEKEINEKVKTRLEENQKDYFLREKLRAIKEELGDGGSYSDIDDLKEKVENEPYPANVKAKAYEEFKHYEMLPPNSGESGVVRSYLEWLLGVPWYQRSIDNDDLNKASEILDEDHYGLEKVKERILEYLAVKQITNSLKSPIICLVGPPGVGKTSLAKSVARALDRKFVKVSLGGVHDEAEIRGHRRTYLGSMPGRIIQGMKKAGTLNPVFLIDEIDKMASDYKGDPSSAMLEVLDPEQNREFSDHYLEEPYDLSEVLFIATANYAENIPAALYDRLEIINLSSYTEIEKVNIARKHLIRKQMELNGLKKSQFSISDDMIAYLIRYYTREAGVRQLERLIGALCRKSVLAIVKDGRKSIKITRKVINEWIGHEKYEYGTKESKDQVGVVTGLAYTAFGGDILPIEVNYFDGKGKLVVTGQLGDVMQESTRIALDYIKANAKHYGIDMAFFETHDIHIHCPEGAVPKDGPSAGVTLTTALLSAITNTPVSSDVAMTGEITLRGNVLPIGGLKEKSMAAHRSGIRKIIIPKNNVKDLDDVPKEVKDAIEFVPVEKIDKVIKEAFVR